jgi:acyl-CoA oxidase
VSSDPLLRNNPKDIGIGRAETYELYAKKMKKLLEVAELRDIKEFATLIYPEAVRYCFMVACLIIEL